MTTLRPYPRYRGSEVEWAPALPHDWRDTRLRRIASIFAGGTPDRANPDYWIDGSVPWLNSGSVNDQLITTPSELITPAAATGSSTRWAHEGSVLVALAGQGKTKGMAARLEMSSTFNQSMAAIVPDPHIADYRYVQLWLGANYQSIRNMAGGDLRDGLNLQHIGAIQIPLPPRHDQSAIADFLDRETAEIDAFIADQEELIGLLAERRAATISHAVTKGLDPTAPRKDSGIEWLGRVPAAWSVRRLSWLFGLIGSGTTPPRDAAQYYEGDVPWVTTGELRESIIMSTKQYINSDALRDLSALRVYPKGSLLIAMYGATVGRLGILGIAATTNQACCAFAFPREVDSKYVYYVFQAAKAHLLVIADGGGQPNINQDKLRQLRIPYPFLFDQGLIVEHLDHETIELDAAISDAREAIALSRERRAALISAAVTGKIDVREHGAVA